jgi:hypothetical protein
MYRSVLHVLVLFISQLLFLPKQLDAQCEQIISSPKLSGELYQQRIIYAGNPFFLDNWVNGDVTLESGEVVKDQLLRYNALEDELIWKEPNSSRSVKLDKMLVASFTLEQRILVDSILYFERLSNVKKRAFAVSNDFFQLLYRGSYTLYACRWVEKTSQTESVYVGGRGQKALLIVPKTTYYVQHDNEKIVTISLGRKSFINVFSDKYELSRKLLKKNGLRIRNEEELVEAIKWIEKYYQQ